MESIYSYNQISIFSSSPPMYGTTLSCMSIDDTPGYPAPEIACIVLTSMQSSGPKASSRAFSGTTIPVVEQLAFASIQPRWRGEERSLGEEGAER